MMTTGARPPAAGAGAGLVTQNVVAAAKVAHALDLVALASRIPGAEYDKRRFPGLIVRSSSPRFAALIFNSGKLVLTGLPHPDAIPVAIEAVLALLRAAGVEAEARAAPKIVNLVMSGHLGEPVSLHHLAIARGLEGIEYEPEQFPGLVYRAAAGVALVFATGAIVVTGAKSIDDAAAAAAEVRHVIDLADAWRPVE